MSKILKTILICILVFVAVVVTGMFAVYKYFVTPERILQISLIQAEKNISDSFTLFSEDEKELFEDISKNGSKTELLFTTENIPLTDGREIRVTSDSDTVCSVTDVDMGDFVFTAYKDRENILINTSLFGGGFKIPAADFAKEWNESIFKDIIEIPDKYSGKNALVDIAKGKFSIAVYQQVISEIFNDVTEKSPIKKGKKTAVMIGSKVKKADSYTIMVTKADAERFLTEVLATYVIRSGAEKSAKKKEQIEQYFKSFADDYEIIFKVCGREIREIELKNPEGETKTLAFKGEKNPFDITEFYKNGDNKNSIRRVHTKRGGSVNEKVYMNDREVFEFENNISDVTLLFDNEFFNISLEIRGKIADKDSISMPEVKLSINETFNISAECEITKHYDRDFSFEKTGEYINVLDISQEEWDIVFDSLFGTK